MAELKFEAPLAQFEESDEWGPIDYQSVTQQANPVESLNYLNNLKENLLSIDNNNLNNNNNNDTIESLKLNATNSINNNNINSKIANLKDNVDNFNEAFTGSLEDLVNTFDEKITKCFGNYEQSVEELAPVQVRSQEEIMNECQMWWTITGNFALKLNERTAETPDDEIQDLSSEDEAVANDLDLHQLILGGMQHDNGPIQTAEEVIKEIDDIMDEQTPSEGDVLESEVMEKAKEVLGAPLYEDKLKEMTISQLNDLYMEMEVLIREFSETLISELALRDELEYEKELKNTFISLLLAVQNKRRQYHVEKKKGGKMQSSMTSSTQSINGQNGVSRPNGINTSSDPKYLTTVIPYHLDAGPPDNQALQALIKILRAINDDSILVPTLLTDYILKVLCPT
ncbi:hypothetical protein PVAND_009574 [Polypedilum vanderplanki]|uniref:Fasciculation and elongation protein zeta-2 n=1 Tax=Polypedilum vanderplanki TaxID=319348 RepID=A0A9J6CE50_POLVA|nr:hypothetical protein PVAND_009574 [Polypedilum vanderplanki]